MTQCISKCVHECVLLRHMWCFHAGVRSMYSGVCGRLDRYNESLHIYVVLLYFMDERLLWLWILDWELSESCMFNYLVGIGY